jgi:DNA-directed RNA polymerase specialized sigma24 family protein
MRNTYRSPCPSSKPHPTPGYWGRTLPGEWDLLILVNLVFVPILPIDEVLAEKLEDNGPRPDDNDPWIRDTIARWVNGLPKSLQKLYELIYVKECTQREAASLMRVSQPRIAQLHRQLLQRGRQELAHLAA